MSIRRISWQQSDIAQVQLHICLAGSLHNHLTNILGETSRLPLPQEDS